MLMWNTCPLAFFFFQAEDGIRDYDVTGVQTCALPIFRIGELIRERIDQDTFRKVMLVMLFLIGLNLIRRAVF